MPRTLPDEMYAYPDGRNLRIAELEEENRLLRDTVGAAGDRLRVLEAAVEAARDLLHERKASRPRARKTKGRADRGRARR